MHSTDSSTGLAPVARSVLRSLMSPPWSVRVQDEAPLSLVAMVRGEAWVVPDRGEPIKLVGGDVALLRGDEPYVFADDPRPRPRW